VTSKLSGNLINVFRSDKNGEKVKTYGTPTKISESAAGGVIDEPVKIVRTAEDDRVTYEHD